MDAYSASDTRPFGALNPAAPPEVADFAPMIGICDCRSVQRNQDGTWQDTTDLVWKFKYILNGTAIQDETWREGTWATSIRQYHADSSRWVVSYNAYPGVSLAPGAWTGGKEGDDIVLRQPFTAPNGMEGRSTLRFYDITDTGFNWKGEWIKNDGTVTYPFWHIWCRKRF